MSVTYPLLAIEVPVARELTETLLIQNDLNNSLASLKLWCEYDAAEGPRTHESHTIHSSLFRDGVVQFVACFDRTSKHPLDLEAVYGPDPDAKQYFKWLKDLRDTYAAHRFGATRQCVAAAEIHPDTGEILRTGHMLAIFGGPSKIAHRPLLEFVERAVIFTNDKAESLMFQFGLEVSQIPPAERLRAPPARIHDLNRQDFRLSRGDFQKARRGPQSQDNA